MTKYKAIIVIDFLMISWSYQANRGKHKKGSGKGGRIKHPLITAEFSDKEFQRVESILNELTDQDNECYLKDVKDYFDKDKEKHRISKKKRDRRKGRPNYNGGSPISKNKLYVIIDYMEKRLKKIKRKEGAGSGKGGRTKLVPLTFSERTMKRASGALFELSLLAEEVEKLKKKSEYKAADIHDLMMLENDVRVFPISATQNLTTRHRDQLFLEARMLSNKLLKEIGEIKENVSEKVLDSMVKLIKDSSKYCLNTDEKDILETDEGRRVKMQKRTIEHVLGS